MTDRIFAFSVALEQDIREDDVQPLVQAILMLKGVGAVSPHVSDISQWAAYERARQDLEAKLWDAFHSKETL